jgi:hypothetical protein
MMTPHPALVAVYLRLVQLDGMQVDQASVVLALENAANRDGAPVGVGLVSGMLYIDAASFPLQRPSNIASERMASGRRGTSTRPRSRRRRSRWPGAR